MSLEAFGDEPWDTEGDCPDCWGCGYIDGDDDLDHTCPKCDGSGFLPVEEPGMWEFT